MSTHVGELRLLIIPRGFPESGAFEIMKAIAKNPDLLAAVRRLEEEDSLLVVLLLDEIHAMPDGQIPDVVIMVKKQKSEDGG